METTATTTGRCSSPNRYGIDRNQRIAAQVEPARQPAARHHAPSATPTATRLRSANTVFGHHTGKTGWTAGGGVEAHLGGNWTGKIEYLYLDFGTATSTTTNLLNSTPLAVSLHSRVIDQVARAGVNYKFDFDYATLVNLPR
jgi:opacity protein-like surface antigen